MHGNVWEYCLGVRAKIIPRISADDLKQQIASEGQISILGSGGKLEGKGGITLSFKRSPANAKNPSS